MAEPNCHYCTRPAEAECPTCGRLYCAEHGEDVCLRCLAPESATPSAKVFRGSVVALVAASLVAVFLVVRPPESKSTADSARTVATATPIVTVTATPTRQASRTPSPPPPASVTPGASAAATGAPPSASASASASPSAPATAAGQQTYTVKAGDTISGIAAQFGVDADSLLAANPGVTPQTLQIGAVLKIPK